MMAFKEASFLFDGKQQTTSPIVTGGAVLAVRYKDGVMIIADTLGSYGSLARYTDLDRIVKVNETTAVAAGGEYSDFQYIQHILENQTISDACYDDGRTTSPSETHSYLARVMHNRRSRVDPLYNNVIVGGFKNGKSFLGAVDMWGSNYQENVLATGFGMYLALPLLRRAWREDMSEAEAKALLEDAIRVVFYRHCLALNRYTCCKVDAAGVSISAPFALATNWSFQQFVHPPRQ